MMQDLGQTVNKRPPEMNGDLNIATIRQQTNNRILNYIMFGIAAIVSFTLMLSLFLDPADPALVQLRARQITFGSVVAAIFWIMLAFRTFIPYWIKASVTISGAGFGIIIDMLNYGVVGHSRVSMLLILLLITVLFSPRAGNISTIVMALAVALVGVATLAGRLELGNLESLLTRDSWRGFMIQFGMTTSILFVIALTIAQNAIQVLQRQRELLDAVEDERKQLETRVQDRTRALSLTAEVNRIITTILDRERLIAEVIDQVQSTFGYYHVHIYLLDPARRVLQIVGGSGEAGIAMLVGRHKISISRGIVGRTASLGEPLLVPDVSQDPFWIANPLLPETKSELAIPIFTNKEVVGVLDVQESSTHALTEQDARLLQLIANQIGVALQNAELYNQVQKRVDRQATLNDLTRRIDMAGDLETVLQISIRETGHMLKATRTNISLDPQTLQSEKFKKNGSPKPNAAQSKVTQLNGGTHE